MSGLPVRAEAAVTPFIGAGIRLGSRFATVVRLIEGGVAAGPSTPESFDKRVRP